MFKFPYKKVICYYCNTIIRYKDAIPLSIVVHGEVKEKTLICSRCATIISYITEGLEEVKRLKDEVK